MRKGRAQEANALTAEIASLIINNKTNKFKKLDFKTNSKELWTAVRALTAKNKTSTSLSTITADDLNNHYAMTSTDPDYKAPNKVSGPILNKQFFTAEEIHTALLKLKKTATGADDLPHWFLKYGAEHLCLPLAQLINYSMNSSTTPNQWKLVLIMSIPKVKNPSSLADYRPISITPILSRLTEKLIIKKYLNKLIKSHTNFPDQFSFRPTWSTTAAIIV